MFLFITKEIFVSNIMKPSIVKKKVIYLFNKNYQKNPNPKFCNQSAFW